MFQNSLVLNSALQLSLIAKINRRRPLYTRPYSDAALIISLPAIIKRPDLSVRLPDGEVDSCRVLLDSRQASVKSILLNRGGYAYLTAPADAGEKAPDKTAVPDKRTASNKNDGPEQSGALRQNSDSGQSGAPR